LRRMIEVREENKTLPVALGKLEVIARRTFRKTGCEEGAVSLVVCDDPFIADLNMRYTKTSGPTDVLAFPMREGKRLPQQDSTVGDIVISIDTAARQSKELGTSIEQEFFVLFVHGLLHLLGYDHGSKEEKKEMEIMSKMILEGVE
jgi:probable rRNA maturation factor